jgi:hypothetical protein
MQRLTSSEPFPFRSINSNASRARALSKKSDATLPFFGLVLGRPSGLPSLSISHARSSPDSTNALGSTTISFSAPWSPAPSSGSLSVVLMSSSCRRAGGSVLIHFDKRHEPNNVTHLQRSHIQKPVCHRQVFDLSRSCTIAQTNRCACGIVWGVDRRLTSVNQRPLKARDRRISREVHRIMTLKAPLRTRRAVK